MVPNYVYLSRYLKSHPEHAQGIGLGRFSFQIPRPLHDSYVRKRTGPMPAPMTPECIELSPGIEEYYLNKVMVMLMQH